MSPPEAPAHPTVPAVRRLARLLVARHLTAPAIMFLEMNRPLSFVASQTMWAMRPFYRMLFDDPGYDEIARMLEDRGPAGGVETLVRTLEEEAARLDAPTDLEEGGEARAAPGMGTDTRAGTGQREVGRDGY